MKLYTSRGVANGRKVRAVASHLRLKLDLIWLDYFTGDVFSDAFARLNPTLRLPVLDDDGFLLWESTAIIQYLCGKVPGNDLYPEDPRVRADINRWLSWDLAHYNQHYSLLSLESVVKPKLLGLPNDEQAIRWAIPHLHANAAILDAHLSGRRYMVGDRISLADYAIGASEFFQHRLPFDWSGYPNINAFYDLMRAEPHLASTAVEPEEMGRRPEGARPFMEQSDPSSAARRFDHSAA
ncbi:glutathione S-transferase family protein [Sphingosinicella soli]|uniref:Glutathione S-transferase n=1 Tax=Sphingosinicella soli TaxID=333708 RepID=A0A7W7B5Q0_9SPHN|nr:glutathione S-transferase family protein [Sphingosinicella soli]MBB4633392.1 glutathione S-transferase [Sphingosinicella soli]